MLTLNEFILKDLEQTKKLFETKQNQYSADTDELLNFRLGAQMIYGRDDNGAMYETLKAYMAKHVSFIYGHYIDAGKACESLGDIALYCLIAKYLIYLEDNKEDNTQDVR